MKKFFFGIILSIIFIGGSVSNSLADPLPPDSPQSWCLGTEANITYDTLPWNAEWHYLRTGDWVSDTDATNAGCAIASDYSGNCTGQQTENNNCMINTLGVTEESNFLAARKCTGNCSTNDPIHIYDEGGGPYPTYDFNIPQNISAGDKLRILVYAHNTATESLYPTIDTKLILNWDEVSGTISSHFSFKKNAGSGYINSATTSISLPNIGDNLKLTPTSLSQLISNDIPGNPVYEVNNLTPNGNTFIVNENNMTYDMGEHYSCFLFRKYVYIDFEVEEDIPLVPHFIITKEASPTPNSILFPNDEITYSITVHNDGNVPIDPNLIITDTLDPNLEFVQVGNSQGNIVTHNNGVVTINFHALAIDASKTASFIVKVKDSTLAGTQVCNSNNQVTGSGPTSAGQVSTQLNDVICHTIGDEASFSIDKTFWMANPPLNSGESFYYKITIKNTGNIPLTDLIIEDVLDDNLTYIGPGNSGSGVSYNTNNHTVAINFSGTLGIGEEDFRNFIVKVKDNVPGGTEVCNLAENVDGEGIANGNTISSQLNYDVCNTIEGEASFSITKDSNPLPGSEVNPGQPIYYEITVTNTGNIPITNLIVEDELDPNVEFVQAGPGNTNGVSHLNGIVTINFDVLDIGETDSRIFTVKVVDDAPAGIQVCNLAENVTGQGNTSTGDVVTAQLLNNICHTVAIENIPSFAITKTFWASPDILPLNPGDSFYYGITVENTGNTDLNNLTVTDILDNNLEYIAQGNWGTGTVVHDGSPLGGTLTLTFVTPLSPGETDQLNFIVKIREDFTGNQVCNLAENVNGEAFTTNGDSVTAQLLEDLCETVVAPLNPHFTITKTANPDTNITLNPGDQITYTITVHNDGGYDITNLIAIDELDDNLQFVNGGQDVSHSGSTPGGTVTIDFGTLTINETKSREFIVQIVDNPNISPICNTISANGEVPAISVGIGNESNNVCHNIDVPMEPSFTITKTANPEAGSTLDPGEEITYTITVENTGAFDITNLLATDILDPNLVFISGDPNVTNSASDPTLVTIDFGTLSIGETDSAQFTVQIIDNPFANLVCNSISASGQSNGISIVASSRSICHDIDIPMEYKITKKDNLTSGEVYHVGQEFFYIITIENTGNITIPQVVATDILNEDLEFIPDNVNDPSINYDSNTNTVTLLFKNIAPETLISKQFKVKVLATVTPCKKLCNEVTSEIPEPSTGPIPSPKNGNIGNGNIIENIFKWTGDLWNSIKNFAGNLFTSIIKGAGGSSCKNDPSDCPIPPDPTTDKFCRAVYCSNGGDINITKESIPAPGMHINNGDILTYKINMWNTSSNPISNVIVTDDLDSNLSFVGSSSPDVIENPTGSKHIILNFGDIAAGDIETLSFEVQVNVIFEPEKICNTAKYNSGNTTYSSNEVCHPYGDPVCGDGIIELPEECDPPNGITCDANCRKIGGGGPPGGGGQTIPTIGVCVDSGGGTLVCSKRSPHKSQPILWQLWLDCINSPIYNKDQCLHNWADAAGLTSLGLCDPDNTISTEPPQCTVIDIPPDDDCFVGGCSVLVGNIVKEADKSNVAVNEYAPYSVTINLENISDKKITVQDLRVYDLTVPAESGWVWNHTLENSSNSAWNQANDTNTGFKYFEYKNPTSIQIPAGDTIEISLNYKMNTALTLQDDIADSVKNVAFAAIRFSAPVVSTAGTPPIYQTWNLRLNETNHQQDNGILCKDDTITADELFNGATSTLGSTASVEIDRPYVEVRTGADLGISKYTENNNPFGGYLPINQKPNSGDTIENDYENTDLFEDFRENIDTNQTMTFGQQSFYSTADDSNVWFYNGTIPITINNDLVFEKPITFVIENANLIITSDFALKNPDSFAAFIVENGNIIINKNVESIEGIFIAQNGEIKNGDDQSTVQLKISGAIMGDATDLLQKRIYIGEFENNGELKNGLQPSVKINYDLRLLNHTPPALESFLGEGSTWGQEE